MGEWHQAAQWRNWSGRQDDKRRWLWHVSYHLTLSRYCEERYNTKYVPEKCRAGACRSNYFISLQSIWHWEKTADCPLTFHTLLLFYWLYNYYGYCYQLLCEHKIRGRVIKVRVNINMKLPIVSGFCSPLVLLVPIFLSRFPHLSKHQLPPELVWHLWRREIILLC